MNSNSIYNTIDYINNSFRYPILNKIHGYPTFVTLTKLKKQLNTNAMGVSCDLGGGRHGHLGLVLSPEEYALVSDTPYEFPEHPGTFNLARNTAHEVAITQREAHYERLRVFREAVEVQKALVKQIVAAIDDEFVEELKDESTNDISYSIPEILSYLFEHFAKALNQQ